MAKKFFTDESLATLISKIKEFVTNSVITPDWNAAEGEAGHVANRTHYIESPNEFTWDGDMTGKITMDMSLIGNDGVYLVKVSDIVPSHEHLIGARLSLSFGDSREITSNMIDDSIPGAYIIDGSNLAVVYNINSVNAAMGIPEGYLTNGTYFSFNSNTGYYVNYFSTGEVHKLDKRFLPNVPGKIVTGEVFTVDETEVVAGNRAEIFNSLFCNIATGDDSHAEGYYTTASGGSSHAEGYKTTASGSCSHAEGGSTTASGGCSHAEGDYTTASGPASHAEGDHTTASKWGSHAEGINTTASEYASHAEGHATTASGMYSHAEGEDTTASGRASHAEGDNTTASDQAAHAEGVNTTASGSFSHAEGVNTTASEYCSHAEGFYTIASGHYSHAQGKYNIEDTEEKYAHIVGNGASSSARSNAHTLDWDGNAWFAGDVYVGGTSGTNKDEGSKKLATEEFVMDNVGDLTQYRRGMLIGVMFDDSYDGTTLDNVKLKIYSHDMTFAELNNMIYTGVDVTIDFAWTRFRLSDGEYPMGYNFYSSNIDGSVRLKIRLNDYGMTLSVVDEELITVDDIDEICGATIEVANLSEVEF